MRTHHQWKFRSRSLELGRRTLVMGVLNVTPDSFSDGGLVRTTEEAVERGLQLLEQGADIIDIGGESTRPGAKVAAGSLGLAGAVTADEECARVLPVIRGLRRMRPDVLISVDTYKAEVARRALEAGAEIVNDVSAMTWDKHMAAMVARAGCGLVMMHTRGTPAEWRDLPLEPKMVEVVKRDLGQRVATALSAGIARERIVLDPGFGFGKNFEENLPLLARFEEFAELGFPLMAGTSRKSFLGRAIAKRLTEITGEPIPDLPPSHRLSGTLATTAIAVMKGAHVVRVHDVRAVVEAIAVVDQMMEAED